MKYVQYAVTDDKGQYIKYPTAYRNNPEWTDSLYDVHLWNLKKDAQRLADYMGLSVVLV